jgi:hypothetical protein
MLWYSPARGVETFEENPVAPQACSELGECKRLRYEPDPFDGFSLPEPLPRPR